MSIEGLLNKALVTSRMGSFPAALAAVTEALAAEPESKRAHRVLSVVLLRKGDPWEAETALLATGAVEDAEGVRLHAEILSRIGRRRAAIERSREAVTLAPDSAEAHHGLARSLRDAEPSGTDRRSGMRRRIDAECVSHWKEAVRLAPEYLPPRIDLARQSLDAGDPRTARRLIEECVAIDPGFAEARLMAGQLSWQAGDWEDARHHAEWLLANGWHEKALTLHNQTRLAGGPLIRPIQRLSYGLRGRGIRFQLAVLLAFCAAVSCVHLLGVHPLPLAAEAARLPLGLALGCVAVGLFAIRAWPRWQAGRALRAPKLSDDF